MKRAQQPYHANEIYQAFMEGYVRRINDATLRVPIGGVRIGSAKYSRLAQINLRSHIITFSRYAIENVPERGRRYLVIHELSHVKEASHNKIFWQIVAEHEPRYKEIGRELDQAFKRNVTTSRRISQSDGLVCQTKLFPVSSSYDWDIFNDALASPPQDSRSNEALPSYNQKKEAEREKQNNPGLFYPLDSGATFNQPSELFECDNNDFYAWESLAEGIVHGGSATSDFMDDEYLDHLSI